MPGPALDVPAVNTNGSLRYYTDDELDAIDLKRIGVSGEGDHFHEQMGPDGAGTPRKFSCAWNERYAAAAVLVGAVSSYTDGSDTRISRLLPDTYGFTSDQRWVCTKVSIDPYRYMGEIEVITEGQDAPVFDRAHLEATYELVPYDLAEDAEIVGLRDEYLRYVTRPGYPGAQISTDTSFITLPGGTLKYVTDDGVTAPAGRPLQHGWGFTETNTLRPFIWRRVPLELWGQGTLLFRRVFGTSTTLPFIGSINDREFFGYQAHSLQLRSVEEELKPDPLGLTYSWDIKYVFAHTPKKFGWLGYYYHSVKALAGLPAPGASGYYQVKREDVANVTTPAGVMPDHFSIFWERNPQYLFSANPSGLPNQV